MWLILPGWGLAPTDYAPLAEGLGADANVVDPWVTPTSNVSEIRARLGVHDVPRVDLIGHSLGGLAALEWALRYPDQVGRLVLLDPTTPRRGAAGLARKEIDREPDEEAGRKADVRVSPRMPRPTETSPGRRRRVTRGLIDAVGAIASPVGRPLRRAATRLATGKPDGMPSAEATERYGTSASWRLLATQLREGAEQERRVASMLAEGGWTGETPTLQLVGAGSGTQRRFLRAQRELARSLRVRITMLPGQNHLFPVTHPDLVLHHVERM